MTLPVTIENDALRIEVWPQIGGKVASIIDKADKFELLFTYPAEIPETSQYDLDYAKSWYQGWDECFPAVSPSVYPAHPYKGTPVPDHGELWGLPTTATPTREGITTIWHGLRFGYHFTRKLFLDGESINAEYTLTNLAPFPFRFVWALHALMSMATPVELVLPARRPYRYSHNAEGEEVHRDFTWPNTHERHNLAKLDELPDRRGWKVFSDQPISRPMIIRYPSRGRSVAIEYTSVDGVEAHWGIWINTGGWLGHRHFAPEPTTGRFDQVDRAIADGSAGRVPPGGTCSWAVKWAIGGEG